MELYSMLCSSLDGTPPIWGRKDMVERKEMIEQKSILLRIFHQIKDHRNCSFVILPKKSI